MSSLLKTLLKPAFKAVANIGLINPHTPHEIELMEAGVKPVCIIDQSDVSQKMKTLIEAKSIVHIGNHQFKEQTLQVYAQADKIEEGKELYARYYLDGEGYPKLEEEEEYKRVGELLGYNQNDISWALGKKYQNKIIKSVLEKTTDWRCKVRKEYMLQYRESSPT
jgi:hypothetical protein